ncbi:IclR family transcriptional regulator [Parasphingorhabdus pacifica]
MTEQRQGTVGKALGLLTLVGEYPHGVTAGEITEVVDYPFSTVYRLLNSLLSAEFVAYDPQDKRYRLGLRIYQLGQKVSSTQGFDGMALPVLQRLTELTRESSILSVLDGSQYLTIHKVDGPQFRITTDPGDHGSLHTTAVGKALLAFADEPTRTHLLDTVELRARTEHSVTDRDRLRGQVERIRDQGWVGQSEENDEGMVAVAVPVLAEGGRLIAAVALAAPIFRRTLDELQECLPALRQAAAELSVKLPLR